MGACLKESKETSMAEAERARREWKRSNGGRLVCSYTSSTLILCVISRLYITTRAGPSLVLLTTVLPEPSAGQVVRAQ